MTTTTSSTPALERLVRRLQQEVAELRGRLDELAGTATQDNGPARHSKEKLAWAKRYGIDLNEFEPFQPAVLGTHTMTVAEAARTLDLSIEQVRRHLRAGHLRGTALGGRAGWRVSRADVARFRQEREALAAGR